MANIIKEENTPFGKQYIVHEANGGIKRFSTREEAEAYVPQTKDPADNAANDLVFTALTLGANGVGKVVYEGGKQALKVAGQAMTPSTWVGGLSQAAGYVAPTWMLNAADLAASGYFAKKAGDRMANEGLNLETGVEAALSLAPFTRDVEAIQAVAGLPRTIRDIERGNNVVNRFRLAREMNKSNEATRFVNVPIEHVSPNGVTTGAALDRGVEGIHFSPVGSSTSTTIQQSMGYPYVRAGTWTYSSNTAPVGITDVGYFKRGYNPDFDAKVDKGYTNFKYNNQFEGRGNVSYLTTEPNFGLQLSKNVAYAKVEPIQTNNISSVYSNYLHDTKDFYGTGLSGKIGDTSVIVETAPDGKVYISGSTIGSQKFNTEVDAVEYLKKLHSDYISTLSPAEREMYLKQNVVNEYSDTSVPSKGSSEFTADIKQRSQDDIDLFYGSEEYTDRFNKRVSEYYNDEFDLQLTSDQLSELKGQFDNMLADIQAKYQPGIFRGEPYGFANAQTMNVGLNANLSYTRPELINPTITHEFGHLIWHYPWFHQTKGTRFNVVNDTNISLMGNPSEHLTSVGKSLPQDRIDYITDHNELRQRIIPIVKEAMQKGWTPEQAYQKSKLVKYADLDTIFNKDYIIKLIGGMLSIGPILFKDNENNNRQRGFQI